MDLVEIAETMRKRVEAAVLIIVPAVALIVIAILLLPGVSPTGWTVVRREIGPWCGGVVARTAQGKDNRAPSAVCGCCIPRR
jgi:hypothetical protein